MKGRGIAETRLVLMLKAPARSKRRLAREIGDRNATAAATHLAACALEDLAGWPGRTCLAPADEADLEWLRGCVDADHPIVLQRGENLGQRINHVDRALEGDAGGRIFIGSDCPELDPLYLEQAAACLAGHDVVLGPATDGGVVLMGARPSWPDLGALPWSTPALHEALARACAKSGFTIATLEPRADIDNLSDLAGLAQRLDQDPRPARQALLRWLASVARQL